MEGTSAKAFIKGAEVVLDLGEGTAPPPRQSFRLVDSGAIARRGMIRETDRGTVCARAASVSWTERSSVNRVSSRTGPILTLPLEDDLLCPLRLRLSALLR